MLLRFPRTLHSTIPSVWLGFAIGSRTVLGTVQIRYHVTQAQCVEPNFLVNFQGSCGYVAVNEPKESIPDLRKISPKTPCESERKELKKIWYYWLFYMWNMYSSCSVMWKNLQLWYLFLLFCDYNWFCLLNVLYQWHVWLLVAWRNGKKKSLIQREIQLFNDGAQRHSISLRILQLFTTFPCLGKWPTWCTITLYNTFIIIILYVFQAGTTVAQWWRWCATNRKVADSFPPAVIGIFHWHKILPIALWPWSRLNL